MIKKYAPFFILLIFSLLMIPLLYLVGGAAPDETKEIVTGREITVDPVTGEAVNYYDLIYSNKKDPAVGLEGKARFIEGLKPEPEPAPRPAGSTASSQKEQQMVNYINEVRRNAGLPALTVSSQLTTAARAKSRDMIAKNYFSHTSPTYGSIPGLLSSFGISYRSAGENIAMNSSGNVYDAHNMLMNSPGHRANILNAGYSKIGVGISVKSDGSHYYTQLFIGN